MNHNVTRNITPPYRGGVVMFRHCFRCFVTCYANRELRLQFKGERNIKTAKCYAKGVTVSVDGQGGQSVRSGVASERLTKANIFSGLFH